MGHNFTITFDGVLLRVKASGWDYSVNDVITYGKAIIEASIVNNCTKVMLDELDVIYALGTFDLYESAVSLSEMAPKVGMLAIVCNPQDNKDATFWETVAVNRGLTCRVFKTIEDAEKWLLE